MLGVLSCRLFLVAITVGILVAEPSHAQTRAIEWNRVAWSGGTLDVAVVRPLGEGNGERHPVIFALPWGAGSPQLVETFVESYWITDPMLRGYYVVAPAVRGTSLEGTADEVVPAVFAWMESELYFDPERVALVGASNGGMGLFFAALSQPERFRALLALPGRYDGPPSRLEALRGRPIRFMVGELDTPWVEGTRATIAALTSLGMPAELEIVPGQDHVMRLDNGRLLDWIAEALAP